MSDRRLLHVAIADDWEACARFSEYDVATKGVPFDETGYIEACTLEQLPAVLGSKYLNVREPLLLVVIDEQALADERIDVTFDPAPRIHGVLPMESPIIVATLPLEADGPIPDLAAFNPR
ncbi:DUF952 domain-containing protein [Lysinibacter cavernae]|uniref:Uncharacterized protein (DUF952 family) n=1 Tax=Lysinibacter cavernae TaxID=1640652 RepID=A0A7X5QYT8_9MICO|nr:DUF952 domain-containing protein [Lysinibacter cavernae]NIH52292.1 uncharacterized protein (DUF952 family) [Lysinibacter cavernae]